MVIFHSYVSLPEGMADTPSFGGVYVKGLEHHGPMDRWKGHQRITWTDGEISSVAGTLRQRKLSREETFGLLARRWFKGSGFFFLVR
jgi:hypothetical protein